MTDIITETKTLPLIKPDYVNVVWQITSEFSGIKTGTRYIIGKMTLQKNTSKPSLCVEYFKESDDFKKFQDLATHDKDGLIAFPISASDQYCSENLYNYLCLRIPKRSRGDFVNFLNYYGLDKDYKSEDNFTLISYSSTNYFGDGFSFTNPFENIVGGLVVFDVAGVRHSDYKNAPLSIKEKMSVFLEAETDNLYDPFAVSIKTTEDNKKLGYVPKGQNKSIFNYLKSLQKPITGFIKRINGTKDYPMILVQLNEIKE